jgi:hypothetical protein
MDDDITVSDIRRTLGMPEPKPTLMQRLAPIGALALVSAVAWAYLREVFTSPDASTSGWFAYALVAFILWGAFGLGRQYGPYKR